MSYEQSRRTSSFMGDPDDEDAPPPSEATLRDRVRQLKDRRGRIDVNGLAAGGERLDIAIRTRTALTLQSAKKKDPGAADLDHAREAELARQMGRCHDLRRVYDTLHAECLQRTEVPKPPRLIPATTAASPA